mmetsp:Transcript_707/g.2067  ORF Transcript_707/g.2067 Transcript_707/m.2067 type:complete len:418 (-) Transcript_707:62-1315(-)
MFASLRAASRGGARALQRRGLIPPHARRGLVSRVPPFALERFFAVHEFSCKHALCSSDTEAIRMSELVARMDAETAALWDGLSLGYTEVKGHPAMLQTLADAYGLPATCFQEVAPQEGILLAYAALLEPGDAVVATAPGYQSWFTCAEAVGGAVRRWEAVGDGAGGVAFDVAELERLCAEVQPRVVAVNFPHNPTGWQPSADEWARVAAACEACGATLFADEIYRGLGPAPLESAAVVAEWGVALGGLSKSLGAPGARIGWLASRDEAFLARVAELRDYTTICGSAPSQILGIAALRDRARLLDRANGYCDAGRAAVEGVLAAHSDLLSWGPGPVAGPIGWVRLNDGASAAAYVDALAASEGLLLLPSTVFDAGDGHVRVGFGRRDTPEIMALWGETLADRSHPATRLLTAAAYAAA